MRSPALPPVAVVLGLAFLVGVRPARAQAPEWVASYNGGLTVADATPAARRGLALDTAGNAVVTGRALLPDPEFRTIKYSPTGARLWSVGFGGSGARSGEATGVVLDAAGNAYVTGVAKAFDGQSNDFLTVKYAASDGHVVWERSCDGDLHDADGATAIAADAQGDVYVTGTSWGLSGTSILTVKYRGGDGAELWRVVHAEQGGAYPAAILADAVGGVVVAGQSGNHIQVIRYDAATGARVWGAGPAPGAAGSSAHALALDAAGNAYVTGYSYAGPNPERRTLKLSVGDGSVAWSVASADVAGRAVAVDQSGGVYVAGGTTTKYAASDGSLVWNVADPGPYGGGVTAFALTLDSGGSVLVTGPVSGGPGEAVAVLKYSAVDGARLWMAATQATLPGSIFLLDVAADAVGDVISAGYVSNGSIHDFLTIKRAGASGAELFSVGSGVAVGTLDWPGEGRSLVVAPAGGVVVTGLTAPPFSDIATVRYSADGAQLWESRWTGPDNASDRGVAVALDDLGDVFVTGTTSQGGQPSDMQTLKLSSSTGQLLWAATYGGSAVRDDAGRALAAGPSGDVYVTGTSASSHTTDWRTIRYSGADGQVVWSVGKASGGQAQAVAVAVDSAGNAYVAGDMVFTRRDFLVVKYAAADGSELWSSNPGGNSGNLLTGLALDAAGNAYVTGYSWSGGDDFRTVKLAAGDGAVLWDRSFGGAAGGADHARAVALDAAGDVYVAGSSWNGTGYEGRVIKYAGADGALLWNVVVEGLSAPADIAVDATAGLFVTGGGSNDFDSDVRTAQLDPSDGHLRWSVSHDGAHRNDAGHALGVRQGVAYVLAGSLAPVTGGDMVTIKYVADEQAPAAPTLLWSTTHAFGAWSRTPAVTMRWSGAIDPAPASGLAGYSMVFDTSAATVPDTTVDVPHTTDPHGATSAPLPEGQSHYFHLRACDQGGNCSAAVHAGPYWIDTASPSAPTGVTSSSHTPGVPSNLTTLSLQWTAAVDPLSNGVASGIDGYAWFIDDGATAACSQAKVAEEWTTSVSVPLAAGTWYAHVCARDNAGNWSGVATAGPYLIGDPADLSVTLSDDVDPIHVNGTVTYTATYANAGPSAAPNATLALTLPAGLQFVSSAPGEPVCSGDGQTVKCALGNLATATGGTVTVTAQALPRTKGLQSVGAKVRAEASDTDLSDNTAVQATLVRFVKGDLQDDWATDLFLRNVTTGENVAWLMNGTTRLSEAPIEPAAPQYATQQVSGVDDFDGDGKNDLAFWDSATGAVEFWLMDGATRSGDPVPLTGGSQAPPWRLAATADFDRDGWPDLLWRNESTQKLVVWTLNGTVKAGEIVPSPDQAVHANWQVVGTVDLNGDGTVDLLWYNVSTGKIVYWWMDGSVQRVTGNSTNPPNAGDANWKVLATGDYGAGPGGVADTADVVWRNETSGRYVVWHLDLAGNRTAGTFTNPDAPASPLDWTIAGPR